MKPVIKTLILIFCSSTLIVVSASGQNNEAVIANADTTNFVANKSGGWALFNSYLARTNDGSIDFEVIVQHNKDGVDWSSEQFIGNIKNQGFLPSQEKNIGYDLLGVKYMVHILKNGKCYLRLVSGSLPDGDPVVIPVQVKY